MIHPPRWTEQELANEAAVSASIFRRQRLSPTQEWETQYKFAREKFEKLFTSFNDLNLQDLSSENLSDTYRERLGEALRYLAGPPISDDDLKIIADVESLAPGTISKDPGALRKVYNVIEQVIDPFRFPWILEKRQPTPEERSAALLSSSVLLAAQRTATQRRNDGKTHQENLVMDYLISIDFEQTPTEAISTVVDGPKRKQFCGECLLGERKADIIVRLFDNRLLAIECKVSNSATNSVKRVNNDAAAKAGKWISQLGPSHVVPAAMLSGVFNVKNLVQAQEIGLTLFWSHDLDKLGEFILSTDT